MNHVDLYVTPALFYIESLVKALSKKSHKAVTQEISTVCAHQGPTAIRHLLQSLFAGIDFSLDPQAVIKNKDFLQALPIQLLIQQVSALLDVPYFRTILYFCLERPFDLQQEAQFAGNAQLIQLCGRIFKLNREQESRLCILLLKSNIPAVRQQALAQIRLKFPDILKGFCDADERLLHDTEKTIFHEHLLLLEPGVKEELADRVSSEQEEEFRQTLKKLYPHSRLLPLQLKPILLSQTYNDPDQFEVSRQLEMSRNAPKVNLDSDHDLLVRLLIEFGFKALESLESCRACFNTIGAEIITPESVARCIGVLASMIPLEELSQEELETIELDQQVRNTGYYIMWSRGEMKTTRTEAKEKDRRRVENVVTAVCEKCQGLSWREVVYEMDHEGFYIHDRAGLQLVLIGLYRGLHSTQFPIELLYRHWTNSDAQLAWFTQALRNPDVFCFADFACDRADFSVLKNVPEEYRQRDVQVWLCLDLLETLLFLADGGFSQEVLSLMETPLYRCPDVLLVALLQLSPNSTQVVTSRTRQQLVKLCVQKFLVIHPNSQAVLQYAWTIYPNNKLWAQSLMIDAMADWYISGRYDQTRLARILDVIQDLKALADLLQCDILPFVIDLACLAARREYLKLDKWVTDKMTEHGVKFVTAALKFLERRCPTLITGDSLKDEQSLPRNAQLPYDTVAIFLRHLQDSMTHLNIGFETITTIMRYIKNQSAVAARPSPPPNILQRTTTSPPPSATLHSVAEASPLRIATSEALNPTFSRDSGALGPIGSRVRPTPTAFQPGVTSTPFSPPPPPNNTMSMNLHPETSLLPGPSAFRPPVQVASAAQPTNASINASSGDLYGMLPEVRKTYDQDVETEVYALFKSMFAGKISLNFLITKMRGWKDSKNERERNLFDCVMRIVYEEHQWLHQYPDKEFEVTARFFGTLIDNQLMSFMALGIALRQLLEFLRLGPSHRSFRFAVIAMDQFKDRLFQYHQYCFQVTATPYFKDFPAILREYVLAGIKEQKPNPAQLAGLVAPPVTQPSAVPMADGGPLTRAKMLSPGGDHGKNGTDSDDSESECDMRVVVPPENIRDKLSFLFNNISMANVKDKVTEFKDLLKGEESEQYMRWISEYIVLKRAGLEHNFHPLYFVFMQNLDMPKLYHFIVQETVRSIKNLLRTEKSADKFNDRTMLKNLGAWLGFMTIAMNRPVRAKDLDMKALIVEAYHKGLNELYYAVPLVTKILSLSVKSRLFGKNNPWIRTILALLGAVHGDPDTKLNLKFEVEVLAKALDMNVADLGESPLLKNDEYKLWVLQYAQQLYGAPAPKIKNRPPDPSHKLLEGAQASSGTLTDQSANDQALAAQMAVRAAMVSAADMIPVSAFKYHYKDLHPPQFQSTFTKIVFNPDVEIFRMTDTQLRGALRIAVEKTLQEFLMPCVERCLRICVPAALVIARKDFALDGDPERVRQAAIVMVRHLASGLSFATMREILYTNLATMSKTEIGKHLRALTPEHQDIVGKACEVFARDNLELCSAFLQKAAAERCIMEVEKSLADDVRKRSEAKLEGKLWVDEEEAKVQRERMPATLRVEPNQLRDDVLSVYQHYADSIPGFMTDADNERRSKLAVLRQRQLQEQQQQAMRAGAPGPRVGPVSQEPKEEDFVLICDGTAAKLTQYMDMMAGGMGRDNRHLQIMAGLKNKFQEARNVVRASNARTAASEIVIFVVDCLLEGLSPEAMSMPNNQQNEPAANIEQVVVKFRDACLSILMAFQDPKVLGSSAVIQIVSMTLVEGTGANAGTYGNIKASSFETFSLMIRSRLLAVTYLDQKLSQLIDQQPGTRDAIGLAQLLIKTFCVEEKLNGVCGESDLFFTVEALFRYCTRHNDVPFSTHFLMDEVKVDLSPGRRYDQRRDAALENSMYAAYLHNSVTTVRDAPEVMAVREKAENVLREWYTMVNGPHFGPAMHAIEKASEAMPQAMDLVRTAFTRVFQEMRHFLASDELATRFFKTCVDLCARDCYRMVADPTPGNAAFVQDQMRVKMAPMLDALARLLVLVIRFAADNAPNIKAGWMRDPGIAVSKMLGIIAGVMFSHQDNYDVQFLAYPFHRIIYSFFMDLFINEFKFVAIQEQIMLGFANFYHTVRPQRLPGFTASWLELVYHRDMIRRINEIPEKKGWEMFVQLIVDNIRFVAPFVRNLNLNRALSIVFRALLRFLYTLLHDYPEVLAEYYCVLVDVIPTNCLNMRNVVLSASPMPIANDDPYSASFKIEAQKGIEFTPPSTITRYHLFLQPISFRNDLDSYLNSRSPVTFLADLSSRLELPGPKIPGHKYHVQMLNALVLYLGTSAVQTLNNKSIPINSTNVAHSSHMDIIQNLAINFDNEGRYLLVNALVNHLRYPNAHTHYYYCVILHLFRDMSNHQHLQELIARVLLERITSHRPHPWGLVATCSQVIRGTEYGFFEKDFVNFNDDLFKLPIFRVVEGIPVNKMRSYYQESNAGLGSDGTNSADSARSVDGKDEKGLNAESEYE